VQYKIEYRVKNAFSVPEYSSVHLDGEIGARFDRFVYERISGKFAVEEILRETLECFRDRYDDEYCYGMWRGEFWGKQILSAVRVCRMKNDPELKEAIRRSVCELLQYQDEDGYLGTYQDKENVFEISREESMRLYGTTCWYNWNIWGMKYTLWALLECALLLDDRHILNCCCRMADWILALLKKKGVQLTQTGTMHGMAAGSLMKPMLLLYRLTGKEEYYELCLDTAKEWDREDGACPNLIANAFSGKSPDCWYEKGKDSFEGWIAKAYEMMSCFDGLIELYRVSGEARLLEAAESFWTTVQREETNILGSVGYCERFASAAHYPDSATEVCDVIHWMRLSYELFALTGKARYMDAFEKAFLNAFLAGIYEDGKTGAFFVRSAGRHWTAEPQVETKYQHCCVNNAARGFVNAAESVIMQKENGYYINSYAQARVRFGDTSFRIGEGYCDHGRVLITVRGAHEGDMLYLRIPSWSAKTGICVIGGTAVETDAAGSYYALPLTAGDQVIRIFFDMTPEIIDFAGEFRGLPNNDYHVSRWVDDISGPCTREMMMKHPMAVIRRGPVMLARSKRVGANEEDMFSGETVFGKKRSCSARVIRHDRMLCACRVNITAEEKQLEYVMCDYASAANRDLEEVRFFTMYV